MSIDKPTPDNVRELHERAMGVSGESQFERALAEHEANSRGPVPDRHIWVRQNWASASVDVDYWVDTRTEGQQVPPADNIRPDEMLLAPGESVGVAARHWVNEGKNKVLVNEDGKPKFKKPKKVSPSRGWLGKTRF